MNIVQYLTPVNLATEEAHFIASDTYNPILQYAWDADEQVRWRRKQTHLKPLLDSLQEKDYGKAMVHAEREFETEINQTTLFAAHQHLSGHVQQIPQPSIEEIVLVFEQAFRQLGLEEYSIEVSDDRGFNFRPQCAQKNLKMSAHAQLGFLSLAGEVRHELVHIIRYENAVANSIKRSQRYLPTEEGLATFCQDYSDGIQQGSLFQHAAEYAVTEVLRTQSFREGFNFLRDLGFSEKVAWQRAIRHKFGWQDTAQPGDIMKPSMYFHHSERIKRLSLAERYRLFVGKIALDELDAYPEYRGRVPLAALQSFYQFAE